MSEEPPTGGRNQFPNQNGRQARAGEGLARLALAVRGDEGRHAEAAIERAQHLGFREVASRRKPRKDGWRRESVEIERDSKTFIKHARQIVRITAACDVGERVYALRSRQRLKQRPHIKARRRQQRRGERA